MPLRRFMATSRKRGPEEAADPHDLHFRNQGRLDQPGKGRPAGGRLRAVELPVHTVKYEADHAFFNDTRPEVYDATAAADAWRWSPGFFNDKL